VILIPCPYCGPRNAQEFRYVGEAVMRPDPNATTPEGWRVYLYTRSNPAGWAVEKWFHRAGCGRYFIVERHTMSNDVLAARFPAAQEESRTA
jgi:sarcosine oxidase, subunit delta